VGHQIQKKKEKWGSVIAPRITTRNHGNVNVIEKANAYQKRNNLEVPTRHNVYSFAILGNCILGDMAGSVNIEIGGDEVEKIIDNLVTKEISRNIDFTSSNHDVMLPSEATFNDHLNDLASDSHRPLPSNVSGI
jgi:hypothetical protein